MEHFKIPLINRNTFTVAQNTLNFGLSLTHNILCCSISKMPHMKYMTLNTRYSLLVRILSKIERIEFFIKHVGVLVRLEKPER